MKKWWNNIRRLGRRLAAWPARKPPGPEGLPSPEPQGQAEYQRVPFEAIRWYGRRKARREAEAVHRRLVSDKPDGALARQLRRLFPGQELG